MCIFQMGIRRREEGKGAVVPALQGAKETLANEEVCPVVFIWSLILLFVLDNTYPQIQHTHELAFTYVPTRENKGGNH